MNSISENINKQSENFDAAELTEIVEEYPYYSIAQFGLLSNYKKTIHNSFNQQASVTALFFSDRKWLSWQLEHKKSNDDTNVTPGTKPVSSSAQLINDKKPLTEIISDKSEEPIAFEPLHTVDYFASQGIKINEDGQSNDKLGTQLKSFTEWLRSMKKVHLEKISAGDEETNKTIQLIAEHSNLSMNVVTEAMADVLVKQGKTEQAIAMYQKLSLHYPSRSAYFAGKISSLKSV